ALVYLLASGLTWLLSYIMAGVAQRTVYGLRRDADAKLARLPLKYFDSHAHGDVLSRVTNDIDNIATTLQQGLSQFLTSTLTIVGVLAVMVWISPLLAAVALVTVPLSIVVTLLVARRSQRHFAAQWARTGVLNGQVEQVHTGHALVQVFGRRRKAIEEFSQTNQALYEASFRAQFLSGIIMPAMAFLGNVSFRYEPEKPHITDFNLEVRPGQTIAIVGPTGAGKTTIVNLLMRFYEIDDGRICLDGVNTRDLRRDDVRRVFGMVLQDTWIFTGTIRDNIGYGKIGATTEEIVAAAQAAYVDPFVRTLPEGYDTVLTDDASNISA